MRKIHSTSLLFKYFKSGTGHLRKNQVIQAPCKIGNLFTFLVCVSLFLRIRKKGWLLGQVRESSFRIYVHPRKTDLITLSLTCPPQPQRLQFPSPAPGTRRILPKNRLKHKRLLPTQPVLGHSALAKLLNKIWSGNISWASINALSATHTKGKTVFKRFLDPVTQSGMNNPYPAKIFIAVLFPYLFVYWTYI